MPRPKNRALTYLRRSTDQQEIRLLSQLEWAIATARQYGVRLDACLADLEYMQSKSMYCYKDIRLDDGIAWSDLTRPGILAVHRDGLGDRTVSPAPAPRQDGCRWRRLRARGPGRRR